MSVVALLGAVALMEACAGQLGSPAGSGGSRNGAPNSAELVGSGMKLVGVPAVDDTGSAWDVPIAADGAGMVWFLGPWQLIRLDPSSGDVTTWDAEDDRRFAAPGARLAAAAQSGVWMLDGGRVRLFDGERFVVDEQLPAGMLNVPGGPPTDGFVYDLVQVGDDLWVSVVDSMDAEAGGPDPLSGSQVVRFADDEWSAMSQPGDLVGGYLTVDSDGAVWDGGQVWSSGTDLGSAAKVKRWDGSAWTSPGGATAPEQVGAVVADPTGGVWLLASGTRGAERLRHFDGTTWRTVDPDLDQAFSGEDAWMPGGRSLAVDQDGRAWVPGARVAHSGRVELLDDWFYSIAAAGDRIVALDRERALLWQGDGFVPVTHRPGNVAWSTYGSPQVYAVSADEAWVYVGGRWYLRREGAWEDTRAASACPTRATDGAIWTSTQGGQLTRTTTDGSRTVTDRPALCGTFAGPEGSVWVIQDQNVVQVRPDGREKSIGRPERVDPEPEDYLPEYRQRVCLHGVDPLGSVWVSEFVDVDEEECSAGTWHRWDGRNWHAADEPDPFTSAHEKVVSGDGIGWALTGNSETGPQITRYAIEGMTAIAEGPGLGRLAAAPGGGACALAHATPGSIDASAIVCYDAQGETARIDVTAMGVKDFSIAPDGAIWVVGPQVARLEPVPALS